MLFSIVIPVYNAEKYLSFCLDSCFAQELREDEFEIVCVNDGSTDGSLSILEHYRLAHPNLVIVNDENHGVAVARNHGMEAAKGDYIWFVDSDDAIAPKILPRFRQALARRVLDRLSFCFTEFSGEVPAPSVLKTMERKTGVSSVCTNLFRREYLEQHGLRFSHPELSIAEDAVFMCEFRAHPHTEAHLDEPAYYYRMQESSAMHRRSSPEKAARTLRSYCSAAALIWECYQKDPENRELNAGLVLYHLHSALTMLAAMPRKQAAPYLAELKREGLFPLYGLRYPETPVFIQKRRGFRGVFDVLVIHSAKPIGYRCLRMWYCFVNHFHS